MPTNKEIPIRNIVLIVLRYLIGYGALVAIIFFMTQCYIATN